MEKYKLTIYPSAAKDIENICNYISLELFNPIAAQVFLNNLEETFQSIIVFPQMHPLIDNPFLKDKTIRKALVKRYILFYRIVGKEIQVIRILFGQSDYISHLQ